MNKQLLQKNYCYLYLHLFFYQVVFIKSNIEDRERGRVGHKFIIGFFYFMLLRDVSIRILLEHAKG